MDWVRLSSAIERNRIRFPNPSNLSDKSNPTELNPLDWVGLRSETELNEMNWTELCSANTIHFISIEHNEWFARNRIPLLCAKNFGIARGQTLLVARRKCMAKSCFHVQKRDFGETSTLFRRSFIANGLRECWYVENVSFCLNNREICDKIYR